MATNSLWGEPITAPLHPAVNVLKDQVGWLGGITSGRLMAKVSVQVPASLDYTLFSLEASAQGGNYFWEPLLSAKIPTRPALRTDLQWPVVVKPARSYDSFVCENLEQCVSHISEVLQGQNTREVLAKWMMIGEQRGKEDIIRRVYSCAVCPVFDEVHQVCELDRERRTVTRNEVAGRPQWCPLRTKRIMLSD